MRLRFADGSVLDPGGRTVVMGILNVTPDSFSDGGRHADPARAVEAGLRMAEEGAELIDVGGESTRPGAADVPVEEELARVLPAIEGLARRRDAAPRFRISIDTRKAEVARRALDAGADLVNDVSALADEAMLPLLVERGAPVALMHMRGTPRTMQEDTGYDDVVAEVRDFLWNRAASAAAAGIAGDKIVVDPGIGFGKSVEGNLALLRNLPQLLRGGWPVLVGASRKAFTGRAGGQDLDVEDRRAPSLAVAAWAAAAGAQIVRVHDVLDTVRVVRMTDALRGRGDGR